MFFIVDGNIFDNSSTYFSNSAVHSSTFQIGYYTIGIFLNCSIANSKSLVSNNMVFSESSTIQLTRVTLSNCSSAYNSAGVAVFLSAFLEIRESKFIESSGMSGVVIYASNTKKNIEIVQTEFSLNKAKKNL